MRPDEYDMFKRRWLETFRGYYKKGNVDKKQLRKNVYDNPLLSDEQKDEFWTLVIAKKEIKNGR